MTTGQSIRNATFTTSTKFQQLRDELARISHNPDYELKMAVEYLLKRDFWRFRIGMAEFSEEELRLIGKAIELRIKTRLPMPYILGKAPFFGNDFYVDQNVLIPRMETELLVEIALDLIPRDGEALCADVGTGSGCIAISMLKERVNLRCVATDISPEALAIARKNSALHGVEDRVKFVLTDVLDNVRGKFDLIVSNPPYIMTSEFSSLPVEVRAEPTIALHGGGDGLGVIRKLVKQAQKRLKKGGTLIFEISPTIENHVRKLMQDSGWSFRVENDLAGLPRVVVARRRG